MKPKRTQHIIALPVILSLGLLLGLAGSGQASLPDVMPRATVSFPAIARVTFPAPALPSAALPMAQMGAGEEEHEHGEGIEIDTNPWSNLAVPIGMILAGLLYLAYVRWRTRRHRLGSAPGSR